MVKSGVERRLAAILAADVAGLSLVKTSSANVVVRLPTRHGTTVVRVRLQRFSPKFMKSNVCLRRIGF